MSLVERMLVADGLRLPASGRSVALDR